MLGGAFMIFSILKEYKSFKNEVAEHRVEQRKKTEKLHRNFLKAKRRNEEFRKEFDERFKRYSRGL
ncbi:hypothetical protein ScFU149_18040 [Streptococcus canis]|nr:hypothetical protein ScOT1_16470 [Streptococcus canis]GFK31689.1 hypothetical protein ScFU149_18040 [Streptococcus canis]